MHINKAVFKIKSQQPRSVGCLFIDGNISGICGLWFGISCALDERWLYVILLRSEVLMYDISIAKTQHQHLICFMFLRTLDSMAKILFPTNRYAGTTVLQLKKKKKLKYFGLHFSWHFTWNHQCDVNPVYVRMVHMVENGFYQPRNCGSFV